MIEILNKKDLKIFITKDFVINVDYNEDVYTEKEALKEANEFKEILERKMKEFIDEAKNYKDNLMDFAFKYSHISDVNGYQLEPAAYHKYLQLKNSERAKWMLN